MSCSQNAGVEITTYTFTYDAFGNAITEPIEFREQASNDLSGEDAWKYPGTPAPVENLEQFEFVEGLQYNQARHYDPAVGRWLDQLPLTFEPGDSNLFRYPELD